MVNIIEELINKTLVKIDVEGKERIIFECKSGEKYCMEHFQDCCEEVYIEDICGDLNNLLNHPLVMAEETTEEGDSSYRTSTWTFYKFATIKGYVTIRWFGWSNGYYSEEVDIYKIES